MEIEVDDSIRQVLDARAREKDFGTTEKYVNHLLQQIVDKIRKEKESKDSYSSEQEEEVKKKLEELGYTG